MVQAAKHRFNVTFFYEICCWNRSPMRICRNGRLESFICGRDDLRRHRICVGCGGLGFVNRL